MLKSAAHEAGEKVMLLEHRITELEAERDRMLPIVQAACEWRHCDGMGYAQKLGKAIDTYEETKP